MFMCVIVNGLNLEVLVVCVIVWLREILKIIDIFGFNLLIMIYVNVVKILLCLYFEI